MVWLHGGGFDRGRDRRRSSTAPVSRRSGDVVVVTINHRLNVFGFTYLAEAAGSDFALSGGAGMLDIVAALQWVRDNIDRFGGDPNLVTIFGQSGGGRKVATLMAMPEAKGLFHRAIIESGAVLRLTERRRRDPRRRLCCSTNSASREGRSRELQNVPMGRLLAANAAVNAKLPSREPGMVPNSPTVDGRAIPNHPWDPAAPGLSASIPLLIGYARTEETLYDRPTPETLALDEAGLKLRAAKRIGGDPGQVIEVFRKAHPEATPWDLWILIATDYPRGTYSRKLTKRKAVQAAAPAFAYRFDWETPEGGGHMRSPHTVEIPFVFNNIKIAGPLISKMPEAPRARRQGERSVGVVRTNGGIPTRRDCRNGPPTPPRRATRCCSTTIAESCRIPIENRAWPWSRCCTCRNLRGDHAASGDHVRSASQENANDRSAQTQDTEDRRHGHRDGGGAARVCAADRAKRSGDVLLRKRPVRIHYEEHGSGFPLLLIAGGGLNSTIAGLTNPFNAIEEFKGDIAASRRICATPTAASPPARSRSTGRGMPIPMTISA